MTDEIIKTQVVDQLLWDSRVDAADVGVTVKKGSVTLKGVVPSYQAKSAGLWDAYLVRGVTFVDNQLIVKYLKVSTDTKIKEYVGNTLMWDMDLDDSNITVSVDGGAVKLIGTAKSYWEKYLAEDDAYRVGGVINVTNELGIVLSDSTTDERVAKDIEAAIERNFNIEVNDVDVKVSDGTVTLSGEVPSWTARSAAYECARYTSGVFDVRNNLTIAW